MVSFKFKFGVVLGVLLISGNLVSSQWQEEPINCYVCEGSSCTSQLGNLNKCGPVEGKQSCATVFSQNSTSVLARGCSENINAAYKSYCEGNSDKCLSCSSNGCNAAKALSDYVKCLSCDSQTDENCVINPKSIKSTKLCHKSCMVAMYARNVTDSQSAYELSRSCLDDKDLDEREMCSKGKDAFCKACKGDKCNVDFLPENRLKCYKCLGDCEDSKSEYCARFKKDDQCYFKFDEQKDLIELGCGSDLDSQDLVAQVKSKNLLLCDGPECNFFDKIPQASHCKVCHSATDINCAIDPTQIGKIVTCNMPYSQCYSMVSDGGKTIRGCINELQDESFYQCLIDGGKNCQACSGENCNEKEFENLVEVNENDVSSLIGESVGDPGHWQGLPLNCYTCEGEQCASSNGPVKKCIDNDLQTCVTIFSQSGTVVARGCSDDVTQNYEDYCTTNPSDCIQCKSSGCNIAVSKNDYIDCIFCDAQTNPDCTFDVQNVKNVRKCHKACMTALYPRTTDADPSYNLERTCLDDKDLDDREVCNDLDPLCHSCSSPLCNTQLIPEERRKCQHCSGESCQIPVSRTCQSYTVNEQCFIKFDETGTISEMGCKSDYDPSDIHEMLISKKLFLCDGDDCNANIPSTHTCRLCNSITDKFCATDPQNIATSTACNQLPITSCYTRVLKNGHTERGCLSSLEDDQFMKCYNNNTTECSICDESVCNDKVFPLDRISCHICNSAEDITCEENPKHNDICHKYSKGQTCITTLDNEITHRGCSSELECTSSDPTKCRKCNTSDCNVFNLKRLSDAKPGVWQTLPLNCYTCSGDDCQTILTRPSMCIGDDNQHCMTVFDKDGKVTRRGCSIDVESEFSTYCDANSSNCFNCNSNGCNNASSLNEYINCIHCDGRNSKDCVQDLSVISSTARRRCNTACMVALQPRSADEPSKLELLRSCLDDKDLDDRDACGSDGSMCKSCTSHNCNEDDVFDDRLECYSCLNEDCKSPQVSKKCTVYMENDNCFILFDQNSAVIQTGCTSEFHADKLEESLDKMITCKGKNCNDFSKIPEPQTCYECDSSVDKNCSSSPKDIATVNTCSSLPNVQCYTKISWGTTTTRGCVSDLIKSQRQACLSGNDKLCSTCLGNKCNSEIFPEDRLTCHKCNSIDDPKCQDSPDSPTVCPVYSESEVCSSKLVNGVTYRGCGDDFLCDDSDKQHCKMCNSSNCNVANLYQNNIGYPGNWQDLPINCHTCIGQECDDSATTKLRKCENNNLQNCVTVFSVAGKVVQRGCSDSIYEGPHDHHCDLYSDLCTYCKSSGCNDGSSLDEYVNCLSCDSATNPNCSTNLGDISKTRKCRGKCMTSLYPRSDETNPALELSRSCLNDKDLDDRAKCESGNDKYCKVCQGDKCNVDKLPEKRLSCSRCIGDCEDPKEAFCPAYRENDQCYILFDNTNDVIQMGCKSDFDNSTLNLLRKKMLFCDGDNCNTFDILPTPHKCLQCNSTEDPLCATSPDMLTNINSCNSLPYTSCYTMIHNDGSTARGCIADLEMNTIDKCLANGKDIKCNACDVETCNNQIYPEDRQICFRCSSENDENCQSNPIDFSACPIYQEIDHCGVAITGETTIRGCSLELNCNGEDRETCRLCTENNCNTVDLLSNYIGKPGMWQDLPLNCYTCEGSACQNSNGIPKMCENNNLQKCETVFDSTEVVLRRGCSDDVAKTHGDYCDTNSGYCQQCKSSGCNNVTRLSDYVNCAFCDSSTNPNCVLNPTIEGIKTRKCNQQCMAALFPRSSEEDPSYELTRTCLDDKDLDDRQTCLDGNDPFCKTCSGSNCNDFEFPLERHECLSCRGEECEDAQKKTCVTYHPNDQCYILFDNSSTVIAMGCRSEYEHAAVTDLIKSKQLLLCDGKNCNTYESIPSKQSCVVCNSETDPQCATNPNLIVDADTCSELPYTGCFTLINENGDTVRGCQSALASTAFYECHTQSNSLCSTCVGNKCNKEIYPANRTTCHRCNSLDDTENCATTPLSNQVCPKFIENQSCVTNYANGITYRGCSSELSCDASDKKTCRICSTSACNTVNLEHVAKDGEPGKWQDLPIKCQTCKDATCKQTPVPVESCSNNNLQNCMTVFNTQGEVIQKGCSDSVNQVHETYCEENFDRCFRCNSNECNKATTTDDYVKCLSCDTSTNASCVTDPESWKITRTCFKGCMTALYPKSIEDDPAYATTRSCLDDKEPADQQTCTNGSDELCKSCVGKECNKDIIPNDRRSCYHCSGEDCTLPEKKLCTDYRKNDQCSLLIDDQNNIIEAGCKSDFTIDQAITLIKSKRLLLCDGNDCNTYDSIPESQSCSLCNSKTDTRCASEPNSVSSSTQCSRLPYTQCYSRVLNDGATERGCLSSLEENEFYDCLIGNSTTCKSCVGDKCNKEIYPPERRACHICDSDSDPKCHEEPNSLGICPKYVENDSCVTSFVAGTTHRGCKSDIQCDESDRKKCKICSAADGCNTVNLERRQDDNYGKWQDLPLECYECKGNECNGQLGQAKKCQNNNEQDCSMVYDSAGNVIRRGCSDDIDEEYEEYCDANPRLCLNCKSNSCNGVIGLSELNECVYCDSSKNKSCVTNPKSVLKTRLCNRSCMTTLYPSDSSSNPAYELIRTCLSDKEIEDQQNCNGPHCKTCQSGRCNIDDIPTDRLRCHSCLSDNCESSVSELCPLYKEGDQCFVRFDSSNSIAEMGCLSAFRNQNLTDILKTKRVYICDGSDCNSPDKLPQTQKCVVCDSSDDVNCAINAHQIGTVSLCNSLPYPNCFTKIASDGTTHRGCLADLSSDEFVSCILSGGDKCSHCLGDGCNKKIFPESRLQCYSCSSETDPDCEDIPTKLSSCPYVRDSEKCVTALGGNRTERGCTSQLLCDTTDKSTCRHCSSSGCNTLNLIDRKEDKNHGMWQNLPLKCHNCTGFGCSNSLGPAVACLDGEQQDCMTVFNERGKVVRRGCAFEVEDEKDLYCRKNPNNCISCKSNECNDAFDLNDFETCAYCNSETDASCVTRPERGSFDARKCQNGCMAASFIAANGTTQVIRTCLDDKEIQDRHKCSGEFEANSDCSSCSGDNCNLFKYPKDRLTCNVCEGSNCADKNEEYCAAYIKNDKCYAKYENNEVELSGCSSDIDELALQEWREKNQLYECSSDNCNVKDGLPVSKSCVACDSSKDVECATHPSIINSTEICNAPITECMMRITSNTVTQRGCLNRLAYNEQAVCGASGSELCETCDGNKCNTKIYPSGRRSCYICQSDKHDNCVKDPTMISICPNYSQNNQCVTKFDGKITERGCTTELTCDVNDDEHCRICNIDGCNTHQLDGVGTIFANNILLTLLVAIVGLRGVTSHCL
ncbi:uncharacterized protein LOC129951877 [Eupeodes corollae]|uniref:uncharacterized protein LOC129951877 n=1 Tax=Eupeodes corollae TaxID=290404 RepID=UPI0024900FA3|nr:uncharacterized protein LOC129951877 [Eupeodes corollae]